jgi:hypothetical protein
VQQNVRSPTKETVAGCGATVAQLAEEVPGVYLSEPAIPVTS